jgi:uncharacterized protein
MNTEETNQNKLEMPVEGTQETNFQADINSPKEEATEINVQHEEEIIKNSLLSGTLGFVNFDAGSLENNTTNAMVSADKRKLFRRDVYVLIYDKEQEIEFLGRVVEGPFHSPHEISADSAITRTTVLNPERTKFRPSYYVYGTIEVLGQLVNGERVVPTPTRPRPYSEISVFPADRLKQLLDISGTFYLGHLMGYEGVSVCTDAGNKNFLPRNIGIFGTVGSGKSNTTQVLIEEAIDAGWAVVVIDVEGEYVKMNEPTQDKYLADLLRTVHETAPIGIPDFSVYVPTSGDSAADKPIPFKVPISELDPFVVASIQEFSEAQVRMFERLTDATNRQTNRTSGGALGNLAPNSTSVNYPYTLQTLIDNLDESSDFVRQLPGTEKVTASTLRSKLFSIGKSGMLDWNKTNDTKYLPTYDLLKGGKLSVLDVSETDDRSRNIAISFVLQSLFDKVVEFSVDEKMPNNVPRPKVMVVLEEVHTFVSRSSVSKMRAVLDNLQLISRRGRKRWMSLAIVSQQPGHVPDELFELANTRFIHQLKSASNLAPVKQTTGGVHEALWTNMPSLGPGQCLLTGAVFKNPIFVNIRPAKTNRLHTN